jgi:hypothetical protein
MIFAYFGPETMLPITSGIAAVFGVFLMFGRQILFMIVRSLARVGRMFRRGQAAPARPSVSLGTAHVRYDDASGQPAPHAPVHGETRVQA